MDIFKNEFFKEFLKKTPSLTLVGLDKNGYEIYPISKSKNKSGRYFPIVLDDTNWNLLEQEKSADEFKDKIKRIHHLNEIEPGREKSIKDDIRRVEIVESLNFGKTVLEFGCSDGTVSIHIARNSSVKKIVAVDIRKSAIRDARENSRHLISEKFLTEKEGEKISFLRGDINRIKLPLKKYDNVCAFEVLEHIHPTSLEKVFSKLFSLLKNNGTMMISVPNRYPSEKWVKASRHRWPWPDHKNFFSKLSLEFFLKQYFKNVVFYSLYDNEKPHESIYLICICSKKKKAS